MNTRTHFHFLTHLRTVAVLSAMITTHSASAMLIPNQQVNPPLAQAQEVVKKVEDFLDIRQIPCKKRFDEAQARLYGMIAAGTGAFTGACFLNPTISQTLVGTGITLVSGAASATHSLAQFLIEPSTLYVLGPVAAGLLTYYAFQECTMRSCFKKAVRKISPVIQRLSNDDFFNGSLNDQNLAGHVIVSFGVEQGALRAVEHYNYLHLQLEQASTLLRDVALTDEQDLSTLCKELQKVVCDVSFQLTQKIAILYSQLNVKEELLQQSIARERENKRLAEELARERDRAAAIQAGTMSYQRIAGQK